MTENNMSANAATITVLYERKLSDGNYGCEGLSMASTVTVGQDDWRIDELMALAKELRVAVLTKLSESEAGRVAWVAKRELEPPAPKQPAPAAGNGAEQESLEDLPF
jgi:hypothetical protein